MWLRTIWCHFNGRELDTTKSCVDVCLSAIASLEVVAGLRFQSMRIKSYGQVHHQVSVSGRRS